MPPLNSFGRLCWPYKRAVDIVRRSLLLDVQVDTFKELSICPPLMQQLNSFIQELPSYTNILVKSPASTSEICTCPIYRRK